MYIMPIILKLAFVLYLSLAVEGKWPPYPLFVTGTFTGTVSLGHIALPYVLYQDIENQLHEDFAAGAMMGAYINGTSYLSSPDGCEIILGDTFPFPADIVEISNATFIGYEILLPTRASNCEIQAVAQHWSMKSLLMGETIYIDTYFEDMNEGPAYKLLKTTMIGLSKTAGTYIFSFTDWDFQPPAMSVFRVPPNCQSKNQ